MKIRQFFLVTAGILSVALGLLGIFLPLLPTTPFLLLAAACFTRSSKRLHTWLLEHPSFGDYISRYIAGEGLPMVSKVATIALLWLTLLASAIFFVPDPLWWVRLILLAVGIGVSTHLIRIKTYRPQKSETEALRVER